MLKACICAFLDRRNNQCPSGYCNFKRLQKPNIRTFSEYTKLVGVMSNCTMYNRNPLPSPLTFAYSPLSFARLLFTTLSLLICLFLLLFPLPARIPHPDPLPSSHPLLSQRFLSPPLQSSSPPSSSRSSPILLFHQSFQSSFSSSFSLMFLLLFLIIFPFTSRSSSPSSSKRTQLNYSSPLRW